MKKTFDKWMQEYREDTLIIFNRLIQILERRNMIYKEYSYDSFCKLLYLKSSKY
jgi:phenolic acid decarboxylase